MNRFLTIFAALACFGSAQLGAAHAQEAPGDRILKRLDQNGDGAISRAEVTAARERVFARIDLDDNGVIDRDEIEEARERIMDRAVAAQSRLGIRFQRMDSDHNGTVSTAEYTSRTALFDLADRNGDGKLSTEEIAAARGVIGGLR